MRYRSILLSLTTLSAISMEHSFGEYHDQLCQFTSTLNKEEVGGIVIDLKKHQTTSNQAQLSGLQLFQVDTGSKFSKEEIFNNLNSYSQEISSKNPFINHCLAFCYMNALGTTADVQKALGLYEQANLAISLFNLGTIYENGTGGTPDYQKAMGYFEKASEKGFHSALVRIGLLFYSGRNGVEKNLQKAMEYFEKAALKNNGEALFQLGQMHEAGQGVPVNFQKAKEYYEKAIENGYLWGFVRIGLLFYHGGKGMEKNLEKTREYFEKAGNVGDSWGFKNLGDMYRAGLGGDQNFQKALECYEKAAVKNNHGSLFTLGQMHKAGEGVPQDLKKAQEYYEKAIQFGHPTAEKDLKELKKEIKKEQQKLHPPTVFLKTTFETPLRTICKDVLVVKNPTLQENTLSAPIDILKPLMQISASPATSDILKQLIELSDPNPVAKQNALANLEKIVTHSGIQVLAECQKFANSVLGQIIEGKKLEAQRIEDESLTFKKNGTICPEGLRQVFVAISKLLGEKGKEEIKKSLDENFGDEDYPDAESETMCFLQKVDNEEKLSAFDALKTTIVDFSNLDPLHLGKIKKVIPNVSPDPLTKAIFVNIFTLKFAWQDYKLSGNSYSIDFCNKKGETKEIDGFKLTGKRSSGEKYEPITFKETDAHMFVRVSLEKDEGYEMFIKMNKDYAAPLAFITKDETELLRNSKECCDIVLPNINIESTWQMQNHSALGFLRDFYSPIYEENLGIVLMQQVIQTKIDKDGFFSKAVTSAEVRSRSAGLSRTTKKICLPFTLEVLYGGRESLNMVSFPGV